MAMSYRQTQSLFLLLEQSGWSWREDHIYAPKETLWLNRENPWTGDVVDFYDRMCNRRERIKSQEKSIVSLDAFADVDSLVSALKILQQG